MRKIYIFVLIISISLSLSSCKSKYESIISYDIPEAEQIQAVLNEMSVAVKAENLDKYLQFFSDSCPQKKERELTFKESVNALDYKEYVQTVKSAKRVGEGIACSIEVYAETVSNGKKSSAKMMRDHFFQLENGIFKITDFNYYPYNNINVVVGSDSLLYDAGELLAQSLNSRLYTDKKFFQTYGDIIMIGTPYDNAEILDLEMRGITPVKVTEDYPGEGTGIVQVIAGADNFRHAILIQGSTAKDARNSVSFMQEYLKKNPYISAGVYFIKDNKIKRARPLDLSTLTVLDYQKADNRIREVQKLIEANINYMKEQAASEKYMVANAEKLLDNPYLEDYYTAFTRYDHYMNPPQGNGMVLITANFTDKDLCTAAFELPQEENLGAIYAFADYASKNMIHIGSAFRDRDDVWSKGENAYRKEAAYEMHGFRKYIDKTAGDCYADASYSTALLRLSGFSDDTVFNSLIKGHVVNFFSLDNGYVVDASDGPSAKVLKNYSTETIRAIENEAKFADFTHSYSNMPKENIIKHAKLLNNVYESKRELMQGKIERTQYKNKEEIKGTPLPYNTSDVLELLRDMTPIDIEPYMYSSLREAKDVLRELMGEVLSLKCTRFLLYTAGKFPGSQYDYARFAAGFINVNHPEAYAVAAVKAKLTEWSAKEIIRNNKESERLQALADLIGSLSHEEEFDGRFVFPDYCLINSVGSPRDKALLSFGLYKNIFGSSNEAYVLLGSYSSYLAFQQGGKWKFLDCKSNKIVESFQDEIYIAFNENFAYNRELGIGKLPKFIN